VIDPFHVPHKYSHKTNSSSKKKSILKVMYQMCQRKAKWKESKQQKKSWDEGKKWENFPWPLFIITSWKRTEEGKKNIFCMTNQCYTMWRILHPFRNPPKKIVLSSLFYELNNCIKIYIGHIICAIYIHQHIYEDDNQNKKCHRWHWGISSHSFSGSTRWVSCHVQ